MCKKILITGGSGFIGRNIKEYLSSFYDISAPSHDELDLTDTQKTFEYLKEKQFDVVIHSANTNNTLKSNVSDYDVLNGNLRMFYNLERCNNLYSKMIYFGSGTEFDMKHYCSKMTEEYFGTYIPEDPYGFSKYIMNHVAERSPNIYNLRLFGVYGKYEEWDRRFISNNICRVLNDLCISVNQDMEFDYLYVDDLSKILVWFIEHEARYHSYNVCSGNAILLSNIAHMIKEVTASTYQIRIKKQGMKLPYTASNCRLLDEIGKIDFVQMKEAIGILIDFYKECYLNDSTFYKDLKKRIVE